MPTQREAPSSPYGIEKSPGFLHGCITQKIGMPEGYWFQPLHESTPILLNSQNISHFNQVEFDQALGRTNGQEIPIFKITGESAAIRLSNEMFEIEQIMVRNPHSGEIPRLSAEQARNLYGIEISPDFLYGRITQRLDQGWLFQPLQESEPILVLAKENISVATGAEFGAALGHTSQPMPIFRIEGKPADIRDRNGNPGHIEILRVERIMGRTPDFNESHRDDTQAVRSDYRHLGREGHSPTLSR